jgi:hypothetical protein
MDWLICCSIVVSACCVDASISFDAIAWSDWARPILQLLSHRQRWARATVDVEADRAVASVMIEIHARNVNRAPRDRLAVFGHRHPMH